MNNIKYFLIKTYLILFNILLSLLLNAQPGKDGAKIVNNIEYINEYTLLSQDANQGSIIINVLSSSLNNNNRFAQNLSTGDLLFIIQIQGAIINYNNDINYGEIIDYESCGNYEFAQVDSVIDAFSIKLTCPITNNYKATGKTLIVRVPRLTSLTINNGGILTCDNWNGYSGGVLVAEILNDIILNSGGVIDVSGKGFRGGIKYDTISEWGVLDYRWYKKNTGGEKGESIAGYHYEYDNMGGRFCRGAPANGGGGGNAHNAGGGGGANAGNTTLWTGLGIPDISTPSWANAWNLEYPGFAYAISPGGGRGGYTFSSANLDALVEGTNGEWGNSNWGGDWRRATGGLGGRPLNYTTSKIFLGGGGGAGDENENYGGSGGNGGGLIYLFIQGNISGNGVILSNGSNGEDAIGPQPITGATGTDGAGGGGAGGTIIINSLGNISGISIYANGGKGGNQIIKKGLFSSNTEAEGPGGGGGGGYIATSLNSNNIIKQAAGGINGTTNSVGLTEFPPNGATKGCYGIDTAIITNYHLTTINDTVCKGNDAILRALLIGNPPSGISIEWYDKPINGNLIGLGDTLTIFNIDSTMTYWVGTCPGFYRIPVKAIVIEPKANAGADTSICFGNSLQLNATGGIYYQWSPITGLNDPYISNPIVSPLTSTNYTVTIYDKYGCTDKDSIYITVLAKPNANAGNDTSICQGQTLILNATGGILYHWAPETLVNNPYSNQTYTSPQATTIYTVTVTDINNCFEIDSIIVNVLQKPLLNLGNDTIICENDYLTLDVSNSGGSFYLWNNGNTNASIIINTQGTYSVIVTDTNGCTASDSINVSVLPLANITISDIAPICKNSSNITLIATPAGGVWNGPGIIDENSGLFSANIAGEGNHIISYTITGLCGSNDTTIIKVMPVPEVSFNKQDESCLNANDGKATINISGGVPPYIIKWNNDCEGIFQSNLAPGNYYVIVTDSNNCQENISFYIEPSYEYCSNPHIVIPNIFSPNNDGKNDILYVRGYGIESIHFMIYDRWGNKVFESYSITEGWNANNYQVGTYVYYVEATLINGKTIKENGTITLIR